jgi:hypothetical protein
VIPLVSPLVTLSFLQPEQQKIMFSPVFLSYLKPAKNASAVASFEWLLAGAAQKHNNDLFYTPLFHVIIAADEW